MGAQRVGTVTILFPGWSPRQDPWRRQAEVAVPAGTGGRQEGSGWLGKARVLKWSI